ncbi:MAG: cation/H(+) antiporter [Microbacterium sp. 71-23]|uniref:cation:proton antiporter n=1 Tax=unclassified Microbacterium TaxID=2609290 RepID=UPI000925AFD5|nr:MULTISPECIES: cation:proton antiporter [unclassified Microbacterium]MBN9168369.1 cation:proton antiporter [Microbacterium sp.]MBN9184407.1 cation:proton antiporter [Microbacterium sp.]MBN9191902.1 cation:proton antiporter [Microbacterium sp.]OJU74063.1 MAG: cation/H(+) antiporter [Microbacterium sp. 71-23]
MHDTTVILIEVGALLLGMSLLGRLAARIGLSPIPLYLIAGLAFGTGGVIPLDASASFFEIGSQIGVILLLALLGLEYSADQLLSGLRRSRIAGLLDGLLNALPGAAFGLILGWGPVAAVAVAGICWVTSSGVAAKLLRDLGRIGNRETPVILSILVIEDLAMAFYLPTLSALVIGVSIAQGAIRVAIAVGVVVLILFVALRFGHIVSRLFTPDHAEPLLLGVLGLTMLVAGLAEEVSVSSAVGAFLVGIALSGRVAHTAQEVLTPLRDLFAAFFFVFFGLATDASKLPSVLLPGAILAVVTMATKILTGYLAAKRAGIGIPGRWRAGIALTPRGEFSIVIAGLAAGTAPALAPLAAVYVFLTIIGGTVLARVPDAGWFKRLTKPKPRRASVATG